MSSSASIWRTVSGTAIVLFLENRWHQMASVSYFANKVSVRSLSSNHDCSCVCFYTTLVAYCVTFSQNVDFWQEVVPYVAGRRTNALTRTDARNDTVITREKFWFVDWCLCSSSLLHSGCSVRSEPSPATAATRTTFRKKANITCRHKTFRHYYKTLNQQYL